MLMYNLKFSKLVSIIVLFSLTLCYIPCECRSTNLTNVHHKNNKLRLSIESNSIQRRMENTQQVSYSKALKRVFLSNRTVTCNDGSQAGFYLRKSPGSRRWVVFFEGGWHCYDHKSCRARWMKLRHLMTSTQWQETRDVGGILSPSPVENPFWHDANHVFVPYCSSDSWSGTRGKPETNNSLRFMGSLIVRQVMTDLIPLGLGHSQGTDLLMAGSSAGGTGVMLNLDKVKHLLQVEKGLNVNVRGVSDSGWFLDREPYATGAVAASEAVRQGWKLWNADLPDACVAEHFREPWRCYFGHRLYKTLKAPLFVFQWLFDEAQMRADSVGAPVTPQQWDYIHEMGGALRESLDNVTAVFAPSCIGHSVLTKKDWLNIKIDDISLADALRCWEQSEVKAGKPIKKSPENRKRLNKDQLTFEEREKRRQERWERKNMTPEERDIRRQERREKRKQERLLQKKLDKKLSTRQPRMERSPRPQESKMNHKNLLPKIIANEETLISHQQHHRRRKMGQRNSTNVMRHRNHQQQPKNDRNSRNSLSNQKNQNNNQQHKKKGPNKNHAHNNRHKLKQQQKYQVQEPKKCSLRLLERCSWPQCNHSCPTVTNPLTGEEMKFLELLSSFGLDMDAVAAALGVDMQTLNNMDHMELVNLLTQQQN